MIISTVVFFLMLLDSNLDRSIGGHRKEGCAQLIVFGRAILVSNDDGLLLLLGCRDRGSNLAHIKGRGRRCY